MAEDAKEQSGPQDGNGNATQDDGGSGDANASPGGGDKGGDSLESASRDDLLSLVTGLRKENAKYRVRSREAEEKVGELESQFGQVSERLKELEDASRTEAEREAERVKELEQRAAAADGLEGYREFVKTQFKSAMAEVDELPEKQQEPIKELLGTFAKDDFIGRLKALRALQAVASTEPTKRDGDNGSPAEPGGGVPEASQVDKIRWSTSAMEEARLAGLVPKDS